ncbi:flagellar basal body P-ring formation chaperone FlgA [Limimaricola cinnabarinus]|jgi:flagella basal body P-ring formation protein FlgA|uniref:Flagella basal body P-ring formation protein FlgA n=1 Tax=Limimaricola cinnabarinus TaxID=1125964 RepID=A0A2G1MGQ7_9RHOB|nr:flagellar basal body P-ring formation chaperone FlgA [Limimaricola cinnabarinus]PHP27926.1 flagella basal body P-ring formation protein FlgA [Limimaricola cinnabarinus]
MRALALLAALAAPLALPAAGTAAPLPVLVEERARDHLGPALPGRAEFEIGFAGQPPNEAAFIAEFWMDPASGRFVANAVDETGGLHRVSGLAAVMVPLPVPNRRLMPGDIVAEADLTELRLPQARLGPYAVIEPEAVIGMQVRRMLPEGRPVMVQSVMQPLVIDRGDEVTITFSDGAMRLTAPGRALSDAHRGQEVRIVNTSSNTTLTGTAMAEGIVEVTR